MEEVQQQQIDQQEHIDRYCAANAAMTIDTIKENFMIDLLKVKFLNGSAL